MSFLLQQRKIPKISGKPTLSDRTKHAITFKWLEPKDPLLPGESYDVTMQTGHAGDWQAVHKHISFSNAECTIGGLRPGTIYKFKVRIVNKQGQDTSYGDYSEESDPMKTSEVSQHINCKIVS